MDRRRFLQIARQSRRDRERHDPRPGRPLMTRSVDVALALDLIAHLEPELAAHEALALLDGGASSGDGEALDRALCAGLARLHAEVGRETFVFLRWKAEHAIAAARTVTPVIRRAPPTPAVQPRREIRDLAGRAWTVSEVATYDPSGGMRPRWLVFRSGTERHVVAHYPPDWSRCSDHELCALRPGSDAVRPPD